MVMLRLKKLARRPPRPNHLRQSVRDEVASMHRANALEAYICGRKRRAQMSSDT